MPLTIDYGPTAKGPGAGVCWQRGRHDWHGGEGPARRGGGRRGRAHRARVPHGPPGPGHRAGRGAPAGGGAVGGLRRRRAAGPLRLPARRAVPLILLGAVAVQLAALSAPPQGSDDLYRYIWDGRVQAAGIDPYSYSPAARSWSRCVTRSSGRTTAPRGASRRGRSCTAPRTAWPFPAAP